MNQSVPLLKIHPPAYPAWYTYVLVENSIFSVECGVKKMGLAGATFESAENHR